MERPYHKYDIMYIFILLILLAMAAFNVFYHLGQFPIYPWDEARHGVSAYEMIKNKNFIVNTYRGHADYWNLKPVLSFWVIMAGYKIAGFNALGLRLFSAIFAMLTMIIVTGFVHKKNGKLASIITMIVLSTCTQYLLNHSARTGDADSIFVFLFTIGIISLLLWNQNNKWLYVSGLAFSFSFLTKSWHSGNIAIIIALYIFFTGKYKQLSKKNWIYLGMYLFLPIFIWGVFRYQYDGLTFFKGMIQYDLLHRASTTIEGHTGGVLYYVNILNRFFSFWMLILCSLVFLVFLNKKFSFKKLISSENKNYVMGMCLWVLVPFILFSITKTKVRWYILPIYPALSILIGTLASKFLLKGNWITRIILSLLILSVSTYNESEINTYVRNPAPNLKLSLIEKVTKNLVTKGDRLYIYHPESKANWLQSEVLTSELADDLHVQNGNFKEFLNKKRALLLVSKKLFNEKFIKSNQLKIIAFNQWGYLVYKHR